MLTKHSEHLLAQSFLFIATVLVQPRGFMAEVANVNVFIVVWIRVRIGIRWWSLCDVVVGLVDQ